MIELILSVTIIISGIANDITIIQNNSENLNYETIVTYDEQTVLTPELGIIKGPWCIESYYNLDMQGVLEIMYSLDYYYDYWVREDGVKMFGDYVMVAANLDTFPRGTIVETSLGQGIVCDTGEFIHDNPYQFDIAVDW